MGITWFLASFSWHTYHRRFSFLKGPIAELFRIQTSAKQLFWIQCGSIHHLAAWDPALNLPENRQFSVGVSFQPLCLLGDHPAISAFVYLFFIIFYCIRNFLLLLLYPHHNEPHWPTAQSTAGGLDHFIDQEVPVWGAPLATSLTIENIWILTVATLRWDWRGKRQF